MATGTMNIALPDAMRAYVAQRVQAGHYGSSSEYVRDLIRKDQAEQRLLRLRALLEDGLRSGSPAAVTDAFWDEVGAVADGRVE